MRCYRSQGQSGLGSSCENPVSEGFGVRLVTNRTDRRTMRLTNAILRLSSCAVTLILVQRGLFWRPLGVSKNALSGSGEEVA